jgi:hypothetical protein
MLIIRAYKTAAGFERYEYKLFYKDANRETKCKRRRGFKTQEQALSAAEKMLGLMRLQKERKENIRE